MRRTVSFLLILPFLAHAADPAPQLSKGQRESIYDETGMNYAKSLYLENNGTPEDEVRSRKNDALNHSIRQSGLNKLEAHLLKAKDQRIRREIMHRLSQMYEQQAEVTSRRVDVKNKSMVVNTALRGAVRHLETLRKEFPTFSPDSITFSLAENYSKLKEDATAERYYRQVISNYPKSPVVADSLLSLGNLYFERKLFETARTFYRRILETPEVNLHPYAHYKVAWCYFNESDIPSATAGLERAILESRKISQNASKKLGVEDEALSDLVLFYAESGDPETAKEHFERLVEKDKANELRFNLARKFFEDGKHTLAKVTAKQLLDESPQKEYVSKLYLIMISVAEKTKDRESGLNTAAKLSTWIADEKLAKDDTGRLESEEYLRHYSQKLHYEAETLKDKQVWAQAKKSYEIYLKTFPDEAETPEVKYRFAVLLMNRHEPLSAYKFVSEAIAKIDVKHTRFKEALRLRIQAIETVSKEDRKKIPDAEALVAFDAYAKNFPDEDMGVEAAYKAAVIAKTIETPELAAGRFQALAQSHPTHQLAKASVSEALAVLVKAEKWEALSQTSKTMQTEGSMQKSLLADDDSLRTRVAEARELADVKLTEGLEQSGKLVEARAQYEKILSEKPSETMGIYSYVRLASLSEQKLNQNRDAIKYFESLREKYPSSKEARKASLEMARLFEKVNEPREAAKRFQEFASTGKGELENQALTNSAVILESLGEHEAAAQSFFQLAKNLQQGKASKDAPAAYEAGCTNMLLASYKSKDKDVLRRIHECARELAISSEQSLQWQARAAWALDQMADNLRADQNWQKLAAHNLKKTSDSEKAYVAMAKLKLLAGDLLILQGHRFSRTNERPEANIGKKTQELEALEAKAAAIIKVGTEKQILAAKNILRMAYLDFAETMETAAVPTTLNDAQQADLKKSFLEFANNFREKAKTFENLEVAPVRNLASVENGLKLGSLSGEESKWVENGLVPEDKAAEVYAKKAFALFQDGKYGEAHYFSEKWKKFAESGKNQPGFSAQELSQFQAMLGEKLPSADPVSHEF